jgi:4-amino-4-deoxychorismate mutase
MPMDSLEKFRREIDSLDAQLVKVIARRLDVCRQVAGFKKESSIPMMQPERIEQVKHRCIKLGVSQGIDPNFVAELYNLIIRETCKLEASIIGEGES